MSVSLTSPELKQIERDRIASGKNPPTLDSIRQRIAVLKSEGKSPLEMSMHPETWMRLLRDVPVAADRNRWNQLFGLPVLTNVGIPLDEISYGYKQSKNPLAKGQNRVKLPLDAEFESLRRTLYNAIDKLERLQESCEKA